MLISGLVAGIVIGAVLYRLLHTESAKNRRLEQQIDLLQRRHTQYQAEVSDHFSRTGDLLTRLNSSYRDIFTHLAQGAEKLGSDSEFRSRLPAGLTTNQSGNARNTDSAGPATGEKTPEPPLDYAPKNTSDRGTLSEEFGFPAGSESAESSRHAD
jgi:uncharacterized membrane-anchored protein YhcB (DUF1043 family)